MKRLLQGMAGAVLLSIYNCTLIAADFPTKPIRMIVPFSPGGGVDATARIIAVPLTAALGKQVIVDNRPGAGGNIGIGLAANSVPDGYTTLMADSGFSTGVTLFDKPGYHPVKDFSAVSLVAVTPVVVVVHPTVPASTIGELLAVAKSQSGKLNFGSAGYGGTSHLAGEMFQLLTDTKLTHVPYKGGGPAAADLAGGLTQVMFASAPSVMTLIKAGRVRALAVASETRSPFFPDLPTVREGGISNFVADNWYGVLVPQGTPASVVNRLHREITKIATAPEVRDRLAGMALEVRASKSPADFAAFIKSDVSRWEKVIRQANIKIE